jgi:apolipoprotein N-acyltransferase
MRAERGFLADVLIAGGIIAGIAAGAWALWPARNLDAPTFPVAAIQGDIAQSVKFVPGSLDRAIDRYETLSLQAKRSHPALVVWPETVIPTPLNDSDTLRIRFSQLARTLDAELVVGTNFVTPSGAFNVLYFFAPDGGLDAIYRKRQLVPFAEHLPFAPLLSWIPLTREISNFSQGASSGIVAPGGVRIGPIICWESAFSGLFTGDVHDGADAFIIATDDAWFGVTAGPYQHAQIAQMRALETGRWIVRAASTGVSGIIAPDGRYTAQSTLDEQAVVTGKIGLPAQTVYDSIGPLAVAIALACIYVLALVVGRLRTR